MKEHLVNVPIRVAGFPHHGGCLYEMLRGGTWILTDQEVDAMNQRSIEAGEGGCLPAFRYPQLSLPIE